MNALVCMSHTPLMAFVRPSQDVDAAVEAALLESRRFVEAFDPQLVVMFGPDHYNGFFYRLMPPFCMGMAAETIGDFDTPKGRLRVDAELAADCATSVMAQGVDLSVSWRMQIDHGFAQPLEKLFPSIDAPLVLPVFINCVAPPFCAMERIRRMGEAVGAFIASTGKRTLFLGSGGLSHSPPVPSLSTATREDAERLISDETVTAESRRQRQARTINAGRAFAAGEADLAPLNPEWDREVMMALKAGDWPRISGFDTDWVEREGGKSAHEIRTWVAAFAALGASGPYSADIKFYAAVREWIAGFGIMHATQRER